VGKAKPAVVSWAASMKKVWDGGGSGSVRGVGVLAGIEDDRGVGIDEAGDGNAASAAGNGEHLPIGGGWPLNHAVSPLWSVALSPATK